MDRNISLRPAASGSSEGSALNSKKIRKISIAKKMRNRFSTLETLTLHAKVPVLTAVFFFFAMAAVSP